MRVRVRRELGGVTDDHRLAAEILNHRRSVIDIVEAHDFDTQEGQPEVTRHGLANLGRRKPLESDFEAKIDLQRLQIHLDSGLAVRIRICLKTDIV